jgi:hypothetical protein
LPLKVKNFIGGDYMSELPDELRSKIETGKSLMERGIIKFLIAHSRLTRFAIEANLADIRKQSENLVENAVDINKVLEQIDEISLETRMLSLHAHVEAAHAGESGKGFAVVAGEIGALAQSSKETVAAIGKANESINSSIKKTSDYISRLFKSIKTMDEGEERYIEHLKDVDARISVPERSSSVLIAIADAYESHTNFMKNFMANINNESYTLANHERCSFGMWYEDNVMEYGDIQEFAAVYDVHKKFHDLASSYKSTKNSKYVLEMVETAIEVLSALLALGTKFTEMMESGAV